ncbi:hypothetical protein FQA47_004047 [Oryzias melastigma]|uniref:Uncharacterized protein n=1 Tax=Oryzias melastigma TaxID=30732 RepID=A0A834FIA8_ORYME|nr:hypothetical protein FQA47_004047 [Oryzias melastigma]
MISLRVGDKQNSEQEWSAGGRARAGGESCGLMSRGSGAADSTVSAEPPRKQQQQQQQHHRQQKMLLSSRAAPQPLRSALGHAVSACVRR